MTIIAAPDVPITTFSERLVHPGQVAITHNITGKIDTISRGSGIWTGRTEWKPRGNAERRAMAMAAAMLEGQANQLKIILPKSRAPQNPVPTGVTIRANSLIKRSDGSVRVTVSVTGGSWNGTAGDYINIRNRLFLIIDVVTAGSVYSISPEFSKIQMPATVTADAPFIVARPTEDGQMDQTQQGWRHETIRLTWIEAV